jgi:YD repeat-containing protein
MLMHDAALSVQWDDTIVVDVDHSPSVLTRTPTEDLTMQVKLDDGAWHREMTWDETACEKPIDRPIDRRPNKYDEKLCTEGCWTKRELLKAQAANDVANEDRATGEVARLEYDADGRPVPSTLTSMLDQQRRHTDRINRRLVELKNEGKDKP